MTNTMNKWMNIELLADSEEENNLRNFLVENGFKFETSTDWSNTHFEIFIKHNADYELLDDFIYNDLEG